MCVKEVVYLKLPLEEGGREIVSGHINVVKCYSPLRYWKGHLETCADLEEGVPHLSVLLALPRILPLTSVSVQLELNLAFVEHINDTFLICNIVLVMPLVLKPGVRHFL